MPKDPTDLSVYMLIEAGQLARAALIDSLGQIGLEPGDDAILFALRRDTPRTDEELGAMTGLAGANLSLRLERLIRLDLITRPEPVEDRSAAARLTEKGAMFRRRLMDQWEHLDAELNAGLKSKHRRRFRNMLEDFLDIF